MKKERLKRNREAEGRQGEDGVNIEHAVAKQTFQRRVLSI
jgi:hypothetical protein